MSRWSDHGALHHVLELANVAGPRVALQRIHHGLGHLRDVPPQVAVVAVDEEPHQPRDVVHALLQGWQVNRIDARAFIGSA